MLHTKTEHEQRGEKNTQDGGGLRPRRMARTWAAEGRHIFCLLLLVFVFVGEQTVGESRTQHMSEIYNNYTEWGLHGSPRSHIDVRSTAADP